MAPFRDAARIGTTLAPGAEAGQRLHAAWGLLGAYLPVWRHDVGRDPMAGAVEDVQVLGVDRDRHRFSRTDVRAAADADHHLGLPVPVAGGRTAVREEVLALDVLLLVAAELAQGGLRELAELRRRRVRGVAGRHGGAVEVEWHRVRAGLDVGEGFVSQVL